MELSGMRQQSGKEPVTKFWQGCGNTDAARRRDMHAFAGLGDGQPPARPLASAQAETDRPDLGAAEPQRPLFESLFRQADQDVSFSEHTRAPDDKPLGSGLINSCLSV